MVGEYFQIAPFGFVLGQSIPELRSVHARMPYYHGYVRRW